MLCASCNYREPMPDSSRCKTCQHTDEGVVESTAGVPVVAVEPPLTVEAAALAISQLRMSILFSDDCDNFPPMAEQHYLAALAQLDAAKSSMTLAHYCHMQGR